MYYAISMIEEGLSPEEYAAKVRQHLQDVMEHGSSSEISPDGVIVINQDDIRFMVNKMESAGYNWKREVLGHSREHPAVQEAQRIISRSRFGS